VNTDRPRLQAWPVALNLDDGAVPDAGGFFPPDTIHGFVHDHGRFRTIDNPGVVAFPAPGTIDAIENIIR
jgi:hypothetical protein